MVAAYAVYTVSVYKVPQSGGWKSGTKALAGLVFASAFARLGALGSADLSVLRLPLCLRSRGWDWA